MSDLPDVPRDPTLLNLLELFGEVLRDGVRVMMPGVITGYDASKQIATVQPLIQDVRYDEQGNRTTLTIPPIHDVPVMFLGPAYARMTWPVKEGDHCELRFSSSAISNFIARGGTSPLDPGTDRRHDLSDAIAWVGLHSPANPPTDAPTDAVVIHLGGGITLKLGSSGASESALLGDSFVSACDTLVDAVNTYAVAIKSIADPSNLATPVLTAAINAFKIAIGLAKSQVIKLQ